MNPLSRAAFTPLFPEPIDQGDPFVLLAPRECRRRYYAYTSGVSEDNFAFPLYASDDLLQWERLGWALAGDSTKEYWAPCVWHFPGGDEQFVMLYSRAQGRGALGHVGHRIYRAVSRSPEGPFHTTGAVTPEEIDFAIDPDVFRDTGGTLRLTFATDFVESVPIGTGLAEAEISEDLTVIRGPLQPLARASSEWQVFDPERRMPWKKIPNISWGKGDVVRWHCLEGPATVFSPQGRRITLYSGGCYEKFYAVGILAEDRSGVVRDMSVDDEHCFLRPNPARGVFAPGHGSLVLSPEGQWCYVFHARFGALDALRQITLVPVSWTGDGIPYWEP